MENSDHLKDVNVINKQSLENTIKIEINLPVKYETFFDYFKFYFNILKQDYIEYIVKKEIESRNFDLNLF